LFVPAAAFALPVLRCRQAVGVGAMAHAAMMRLSLSCAVSSSSLSCALEDLSAAGARISSASIRAAAFPLSSSSSFPLGVGHYPGRAPRRPVVATSALLGLETELSDDAMVASPALSPAKWGEDSSQSASIEVDAVTEAELKENGFRSTRRTKLVCTIGPATCAPAQLEALAIGGMNVARLNMCHGTRDWHTQVIRNVRSLNSEKGYSVAIMMDTEGSEIHLGDFGAAPSVKAEVSATLTPSSLHYLH